MFCNANYGVEIILKSFANSPKISTQVYSFSVKVFRYFLLAIPIIGVHEPVTVFTIGDGWILGRIVCVLARW